MPTSRLDIIYRKFLLTKFFTKGWGSPETIISLLKFLKYVSKRELCYQLVPEDQDITITDSEAFPECRVLEGKFLSPFAYHLPELVRPKVREACFQMILPLKWPTEYRPVCIHLAGTGDHYYWRRRLTIANPLVKAGIGSIILENPFYGMRKPEDQSRSSLHNVTDIFVMGGCLITECLVLLKWCEKIGLGPLGVSGLSMGGHMASLAATNWPKPLVLVPCLSWSTASSVFTEGVMSEAIDWELLQNQFVSNRSHFETLSRLCRIVDDPTKCQLSKIPEYSFDSVQFRNIPSTYVTPYEMLTVLNSGLENCSSVRLKASSQIRNFLVDSAVLNVLLDNPIFAFTNTAHQKRRNKEAVWFMKGIMDECTHLRNFSVPYDTSLIIAICAKADAYVPREGCSNLEDIWPGATVRYLNAGHVSAYILHQKVFRNAIIEAFQRAKRVYDPPVGDLYEKLC